MHRVSCQTYLSDANVNWSSDHLTAPRGQRKIAQLRTPNTNDCFGYGEFAGELRFLEAKRETPPLFVSYFTADTPYEALANRLRASLDKFGLPHRIEAIPSRGSWVANTGLKSAFIEKVWTETEGPICWVDADAELLRRPDFVFGNPFDFAIVRRKGWYDISSFVYLGSGQVVGEMISEWAELCRSNPNIWDQVLLTLAWYKTNQRSAFSSLWLNDGIFRFPRPKVRDLRDKIFYYPFHRKIRPFLDQKQASRDLKSFVDKSKRIENELGSDDMSADFQSALTHGDFSLPGTLDAMFGPQN